MRLLNTLIIIFFVGTRGFSQGNYPKNYFNAPLVAGNGISSNFGEIRPSHFHAGLDYNVKQGENVFVAAKGYVSRVKVSSKGYGNAIYITHPNGFVSVYAHLSSFYPAVSDYVYKVQHERQKFEIDDYLYPGEYQVRTGDIIGKTGNTGRSSGPHLHFEIRDELSEEPINPLYFGLKLSDREPPKFDGIYIYRFAQGMSDYKYLYSELIKNTKRDTLKTFGIVGFGAEIHDYMIKTKNEKFGLYQLELFIDDSLVYKFQMERISFDESKYLNSFVDFDRYQDNGLKISKCFIEPNNKLKVYKTTGNGLFDFSDNKLHSVKMIGKDIAGNSSQVDFLVLSDSSCMLKDQIQNQTNVKLIDCKKTYDFSSSDFYIHFPDDALYYNIYFKYNASRFNTIRYSDYHTIHYHGIPLHNLPTIRIKPREMPEHLKSKALIVGINRNHQHFSVGGDWKGDSLETKINSFGTYYVSVDTIEPAIKKVQDRSKRKTNPYILKFKIWDNLSGIGDIVGYIDNNWVLFEYDEKNNLISCNLAKEKIARGQHDLVLWVSDLKGNIASFEAKFIY